MALWRMPDGLRVEHALQSGSEISPFYDSMVAKLISHGATREEARRRLIEGLEQTAALGVTTNQAFLAACLRHPEFAAGEATTAFIGRNRADLLLPRQGVHSDAALAALLLYVTDPFAPPSRSGRTLATTFPRPARVELDKAVYVFEIVHEREGGYTARLDGTEYRFEIDEINREAVRFRIDGLTESATIFRDGDHLYFLRQGITFAARDLTLSAPAVPAASSSDGRIMAAMNGRVVAVLVKQGERVRAGQPVLTLEAMKMEHVHSAAISGTVSSVNVTEGEQVTAGKIVVEIEAERE
jgi:geranyl-CoA carboxylase alpha subunit